MEIKTQSISRIEMMKNMPELYLRDILSENIRSVIDVGAGHGGVFDFAEWEKRWNNGKGMLKLKVCTDIHRIREDIPNTWKKIICDASKMGGIPYTDNTFDVVICCEVIEHVSDEDKEGLIKELERLSKDVIFVTTSDISKHIGPEQDMCEKSNPHQKYIGMPDVQWFIDREFTILYADKHHIKVYKKKEI